MIPQYQIDETIFVNQAVNAQFQKNMNINVLTDSCLHVHRRTDRGTVATLKPQPVSRSRQWNKLSPFKELPPLCINCTKIISFIFHRLDSAHATPPLKGCFSVQRSCLIFSSSIKFIAIIKLKSKNFYLVWTGLTQGSPAWWSTSIHPTLNECIYIYLPLFPSGYYHPHFL